MTLLGGVALALAMVLGEARAAACSREEMANAETAVSAVRDWGGMYDAFHRFSLCDDAAVAEAFSHSVVHKLASGWDELYELEYFAEANRWFRGFVLKHIDATADESELRRVWSHAKECPGYARPICREIENRVRAALSEREKD